MPGDLPDRVRLPDGGAEPFEPERITRSLFAAAERVGPADAFLSQELTEGVLHFLAAEATGDETTPADIAGVVGKVVRELGHPALALAYEERSTPQPTTKSPAPVPSPPDWVTGSRPAFEVTQSAAADRLSEFSLSHVYPRDLVSAHREGLIRLTDLGTPLELAGLVTTPGVGAWTTIVTAREHAGEFVAFDGPEYDLAAQDGSPDALADQFVNDAHRATFATGLIVILNLNGTAPPRYAQGGSPLFGSAESPDTRRRDIALALGEKAGSPVRVYWHMGGAGPVPKASADVEFIFDRPRSPVVLGPGLDRSTPAVLTQVGLNLTHLLDQLGGPPVDPDVFLKKVASLTRFAKTAGHVRQDFLRKHARPGVREAFLLDRARLVLVPMGLAEVAAASDRPPIDFARDILKAIRHAAETDRPRVLPVRVDSPLGEWGDLSLPAVTLKQQLKAASVLHAATGVGRQYGPGGPKPGRMGRTRSGRPMN